jgi:hypothetical protein
MNTEYPLVIAVQGDFTLPDVKRVSSKELASDYRLHELNSLLAVLNTSDEKAFQKVKGEFTRSVGRFIRQVERKGLSELTITVSTNFDYATKTVGVTFSICGQV